MKNFKIYNDDFSLLTEWRLPQTAHDALQEQNIYGKILSILKNQLANDNAPIEHLWFKYFNTWTNKEQNIKIEVSPDDGGIVAGASKDQDYIRIHSPNFWEFVRFRKSSPMESLRAVFEHELFHAIDPSFNTNLAKDKGSGKNVHLRSVEIPAWLLTLITLLKSVIKKPEQLAQFKNMLSLPSKQFVDELRILLYRNKLEKYGRDVFSYWQSHPEVMKLFRQKLYKSFFE